METIHRCIPIKNPFMRKSILYLTGLAVAFAISLTIFSQKGHPIPPVPPVKLEVSVPQPPVPPPPPPANIKTAPEIPALPPAPPPPPPPPKEVI